MWVVVVFYHFSYFFDREHRAVIFVGFVKMLVTKDIPLTCTPNDVGVLKCAFCETHFLHTPSLESHTEAKMNIERKRFHVEIPGMSR